MRRRWWPVKHLIDALGDASLGPELVAIAMLALTVLFVLIWPVWFAAKMLGLQRWAIVIKRDEEWVATEKVRGWSASEDRVESIIAAIRAGDYPLIET